MYSWILLGIIAFSGFQLSKAQISELSNSPYGNSGGTYMETLWSNRKSSSRGTSGSRSRQDRQRVINPRNFNFARTSKPLDNVQSQFGQDLPWSVKNAQLSNNGPFQPAIEAEAKMYKTEVPPPTTVAYGRLLSETNQNGKGKVTSRYPSLTSWLPKPSIRRSRFRVMEDGSLVDYGLSTFRIDHRTGQPVTREIRPTVAQPRPTQAAEVRPATVRLNPPKTTRRVSPTAFTRTVDRTSLAPARISTKPMRTPAVKPVENIKPSAIWTRPASAVTGVAIHVPLTRPVTPKPRIAVDDAVVRLEVTVLDDPNWKFEPKTDARTNFYTQTYSRSIGMTQAQTTTTTTTTTTTPAPTTTTEKRRTIWNGPDAVNITYGDEKHVCPPSRARWQDYTVYLETKPRLCMVQITWNARYKREPIYHNSWWGVDIEWRYKTVYDPEVKFVDLHGWH